MKTVNLTRGQKNRLTRLAANEADRLETVYFGGAFIRNGGTAYVDSRGYRLRRATDNRNYTTMLRYIPKTTLRSAGFAN